MKRKSQHIVDGSQKIGILKKRPKIVISEDELRMCFRQDLFDSEKLRLIVKEYASSSPYRHGVINSLINDLLLRTVRTEILENIHFTLKETDIYKIFQSGDLANLDGLDDGALEKLPSLLRLRNALYSSSFRNYISAITGCGDLSGRKTDMAVNVYTPGCYLLCHDDVIGSRRVSYILYLVDPEKSWKEDWGGSLRLFPTITMDEDGVETVIPGPDPQKSIPPAWNQLSFFAVQPSKSFHDVEEVHYAATMKQLKKDGGRVRMAISGWYHIPQKGEEGYVQGEEEKWGQNSSLKQLQGNPDKYDFPKPQPIPVKAFSDEEREFGLSESDLDFLLQYITPNYLTPETLEAVAKQFMELSCVTLESLLSWKFSERVKKYIEAQEKLAVCSDSVDIKKILYEVARPPHKHHYLYTRSQSSLQQYSSEKVENPLDELLTTLFPSKQFRRWLELATDCTIETYDLLLRRFRRGLDYSLAKRYDGKPQLEISMSLTPSSGWGEDEEQLGNEEDRESSISKYSNNSKPLKNDLNEVASPDTIREKKHKEGLISSAETPDKNMYRMKFNESMPREDVGGQEIYMLGDDDEAEDVAIYKHSLDDEDENVLFIIPPSWNKMSIVLRDPGALKFVKYVSKSALGDRWDISGTYGVMKVNEEESSDFDDPPTGSKIMEPSESSDEEFNGFSDSEESITHRSAII